MITESEGIDMEILRRNVYQVFGADKGTVAYDSLTSVNDRYRFACHHFRLLRKLIDTQITPELQARGFWEYINFQSPDLPSFSHSMYDVRLHTIDCVQHIHAIGDTLAHAIYQCTNVPSGLENQEVNLWSVRKKLPDPSIYRKCLDDLAAPSFKHLADLNNRAKHQTIVKPQLRMPSETDMVTNKSNARDLVLFPRIEYVPHGSKKLKSNHLSYHEETAIVPFLRTELDRIGTILLNAMAAIARQLQTSATEALR